MANGNDQIQGVPSGLVEEPYGSETMTLTPAHIPKPGPFLTGPVSPAAKAAPIQGVPVGLTEEPYSPPSEVAASSGETPYSQLPSAQGIADTTLDVLKGHAQGFMEEMGKHIQSIPGLGKLLISPEAMAAERATFAPKTKAQDVGQVTGEVGENLYEFIMGDKALAGLSLVEKAKLIAQAAKLTKGSPYLAKLLEHGATFSKTGFGETLAAGLRQGSISYAQARANGASHEDAMKSALETAGIGGTLTALGQTAARTASPIIKGAAELGKVGVGATIAGQAAVTGLTPQQSGETDEDYIRRVSSAGVQAYMGGRGVIEAGPDAYRAVRGVAQAAAQPWHQIADSPERKMIRAAAGSAGVSEQHLVENTQRALPYLVEENKTTPIDKPEEVAEAASNAKQKIWAGFGAHPGETIDGDVIAQRIKDEVTPATRKHFKAQSEAIDEWADTFKGPYDLDASLEAITDLNSKLRNFYRLSPSDQFRAATANPELGMLQNGVDALRDHAFDKLAQLGQPDVPELRKDYGALNQMQRIFEKRAVVYGRQAPFDLKQNIGAIAAIASGHPMAAAIPWITKYLNSPEYLTGSALRATAKIMEKTGKTAAERPLVPPKTPPAGVPPAGAPSAEAAPPGAAAPMTEAAPEAAVAPAPTGEVTPVETPIEEPGISERLNLPVGQKLPSDAEAESKSPIEPTIREASEAALRRELSPAEQFRPKSRYQLPINPAMELPSAFMPEDMDSGKVHQHEWGHATNAIMEGHTADNITSHLHPDSQMGDIPSLAQTRMRLSGLPINEKGRISEEDVARNMHGVLATIMGGPATNELIDGTSWGEQKGFISDRILARTFLNKVGVPDHLFDEYLQKGIDRAKKNLTQPGILDTLKKNAAVREDNLPPEYHASNSRMSGYTDEIKRIQDENRRQAGTRITDSDAVSRAIEPVSGLVDTGREGESPSGARGIVAAASQAGVTRQEHATEVLKKIAGDYGATNDPSGVSRGGSLIMPDGRFIHLGSADHPQVIDKSGYQTKVVDNRVPFINESGAVRTNTTRSRAGDGFHVSVPRTGVTPEQMDAIKAGAREVLGSERGPLWLETADKSAAIRTAYNDFATANDVEPLLRKIGAHPEMHGKISAAMTAKSGWADKAARIAKETDGFTIDPATGEEPAHGYMVEAHPESRQVLDHDATPEDIQNFYEDNKKMFDEHPELHVGGYKNELNVSAHTTDRVAAEALAKKLDQKSIWDVANKTEIQTGGKGEQTSFPYYPLDSRMAELRGEESKTPTALSSELWADVSAKTVPIVKGSTVSLMDNPLKIKGTSETREASTLDVAKALNKYTKKELPALKMGKAEPEEQIARAKSILADEARYQLAQDNTGTEWYTKDIQAHDDVLREMRPELADPAKRSLFKMSEAVLSPGQKPYANFKLAVKNWDHYNETGEFSLANPDTNRSWGQRQSATYGNAMGHLNDLVAAHGEKGASDWLLSEHPVKELREYNPWVAGWADESVPGVLILGAKRGPFAQNLHGQEAAFTADRWVSRSWNRWMGTIEHDSATGEITSDSPRNQSERKLMKQSFSEVADELGLTTSSLQATMWYYEQALYDAHGSAKESWSFSDAARRAQKEETERLGKEGESFPSGESALKTESPWLGFMKAKMPEPAGRIR